VPGTAEELANRASELDAQARALEARRAAAKVSADEAARLTNQVKGLLEEAARVQARRPARRPPTCTRRRSAWR
jgi:hypothetical protein